MDPQPLSPSEWGQIGTMLWYLWGALGCAFVAGFSLLTAHAIITSLVDSQTISSRWSNLRLPLYAIGVLGVIGVVVFFVLAFTTIDWIDVRYSRYWQ